MLTPSIKANENGRGRGFVRGKGKYVNTCYRCGVEGHKPYECPKKQNSSNHDKVRLQVPLENETSTFGENVIVLQQKHRELNVP